MDDRQVLQETARRLAFIQATAFRDPSNVLGSVMALKKLVDDQLAKPSK